MRGHLPTTGVGLGFGAVFVGVGSYELSTNGLQAPVIDLVVAGLLIVLGLLLATLSLRAGLLDPIVRIQLDGSGVRLQRRWRNAEVLFPWKDPALDLELEDPAPDPAVPPENKRHVFFTVSSSLYGSLDRAQCGPLFDAARAHGLRVRMWNDRFRAGRQDRVVRRIRISSSDA